MHQQQDSILLGRRAGPTGKAAQLGGESTAVGGREGGREVRVWCGPYLVEGCGGELRGVPVEGQARDALVVRRVDLAQRLAARQLEHL